MLSIQNKGNSHKMDSSTATHNLTAWEVNAGEINVLSNIKVSVFTEIYDGGFRDHIAKFGNKDIKFFCPFPNTNIFSNIHQP